MKTILVNILSLSFNMPTALLILIYSLPFCWFIGDVEYTLHPANNSHNACGTLHKHPARTVYVIAFTSGVDFLSWM